MQVTHGIKVFLLQHTYEKECGCLDFKILGIFSTKAIAEENLKISSTQLGFSDHPNGFYVAEYLLDIRHWDGGFFTYEYEAEEAEAEDPDDVHQNVNAERSELVETDVNNARIW